MKPDNFHEQHMRSLPSVPDLDSLDYAERAAIEILDGLRLRGADPARVLHPEEMALIIRRHCRSEVAVRATDSALYEKMVNDPAIMKARKLLKEEALKELGKLAAAIIKEVSEAFAGRDFQPNEAIDHDGSMKPLSEIKIGSPAQMPSPPPAVCSHCQLPFTSEQPAIATLHRERGPVVLCRACYDAAGNNVR